MKQMLAGAGALAVLALAACGGDDDTKTAADGSEAGTEAPTGGDKEPATKPAPAKQGTGIKVSDSEYGRILFDEKDQAIYLFAKEKSDESQCYGACADEWPPVTTKGAPGAGKGAKGDLLGTTQRRDGTTQVTYDGHPLYYYKDDPPGEVLCHNVNEFGGLWLVVEPSGRAVQ